MAIILIACTDITNGIGREDGSLLFNIPEDMKRFKSTTNNNIVVFGRKTWESLPKKPLENRVNYVLTKDNNYKADGAIVLHSINDVLHLSTKYDVYICGGGEIYNQFMEYANKIVMTHVHVIDASAEVFFPEIDTKQWKITIEKKFEQNKSNPHSFVFAEYNRKK